MTTNTFKIGALIENESRIKNIPEKPGIYKVFIYRDDNHKVKFDETAKNAKAAYKAYEANVKIDEAKNIDKHVIYIGRTNDFRRRTKELMHMPRGGNRHRGGIEIWLISDKNLLYVELFESTTCVDKELEALKRAELKKFKELHNGKLPFANKQG